MPEPRGTRALSRPAAVFCLLLCLAALASCGKKDNPEPRMKNLSFELQNVAIEPAGGCLDLNGNLSANARNLDRFRLDITPLNSAEDCPGCPFLAAQSVYFSPSEAGLDLETGAFRLNYCPESASLRAPAYRWRLFAVNVHDKLKHAATPVRLVVMP